MLDGGNCASGLLLGGSTKAAAADVVGRDQAVRTRVWEGRCLGNGAGAKLPAPRRRSPARPRSRSALSAPDRIRAPAYLSDQLLSILSQSTLHLFIDTLHLLMLKYLFLFYRRGYVEIYTVYSAKLKQRAESADIISAK